MKEREVCKVYYSLKKGRDIGYIYICVCVCVCVCMYIYMYIHTYINIIHIFIPLMFSVVLVN